MSVLNFVPTHVWVLRQSCFKNNPLLEDPTDRRRWMYWLFQVRRRYGLSVLNYAVLPNEIQLLVMDRRRGEIRLSMNLLAERMAADYRRRYARASAKASASVSARVSTSVSPLWDGEYQATRIELTRPDLNSGNKTENSHCPNNSKLRHCIIDMDISVVRSDLAEHPSVWRECGYYELLNPSKFASRIDITALQRLFNPVNQSQLRLQRERWVTTAIQRREGICREGIHRQGRQRAHVSSVKNSKTLTFPLRSSSNWRQSDPPLQLTFKKLSTPGSF